MRLPIVPKTPAWKAAALAAGLGLATLSYPVHAAPASGGDTVNEEGEAEPSEAGGEISPGRQPFNSDSRFADRICDTDHSIVGNQGNRAAL